MGAAPPVLSSAGEAAREFGFAPQDFDRVCRLIYQRAGISLHPGKQAMVYSRLSRRLRETQYRSFSSYLQWLEAEQGPAAELEWQEFVNCLTTDLLRKHPAGKPVRIWCNAASTGEEPYSIAMTAIETLGPGAPVRVVASDIDTRVLATASRGVYPDEVRGLSADRLKRHCLRGTGRNAGQICIKPEVSKLIEFRSFNLMSPAWSLGEPFDIVFCRNVMIYFDRPTQRRVLERMHAAMAPSGWLFVGHSENFSESRDLFRLHGKTVYQRV